MFSTASQCPKANEKTSSPLNLHSQTPGTSTDITEIRQSETSSPPVPYTAFTNHEKRLLTLLLGLATITSPLTATIYFPLLPLLRTHFNTSSEAINFTITLYIIFQALSPAIFGPLSDTLGRRPIYVLTLSLYVIGNLGLALNRKSYVVLLVLRALQSLGASAAYAVSFGVVADVCVPSERGRMLGPVSMALNLGACVGPVVGGWVAFTSGSYEWVFWALVIVGVVLLGSVVGLLPETARSVVGNGIERPFGNAWWTESLYSLSSNFLRARKKSKQHEEAGTPQINTVVQKGEQSSSKSSGFWTRGRFKSPLSCLRIIFHYDTFLVLWMHGSFYTVDYIMVAALPDIYKGIYHFNELKLGLAYLPRGAGIVVGGFILGKAMDYNYRFTARSIGWSIDRVSGDELKDFPIERARSRGSFWMLGISTATLVGYGWAVEKRVSVSVLLIMQFMQGFWGTYFYTTYNTLLVDVFPESPSTAAAAASITRCAMAATGVAVLQPLLAALGRGWFFTILGAWSGAFGMGAVYLIRKKGVGWRRKRLDQDESSQQGRRLHHQQTVTAEK